MSVVSFELQTLIDEQRMDYLCDVAPRRVRLVSRVIRFDNPDYACPIQHHAEDADTDPTIIPWLESWYSCKDTRLAPAMERVRPVVLPEPRTVAATGRSILRKVS